MESVLHQRDFATDSIARLCHNLRKIIFTPTDISFPKKYCLFLPLIVEQPSQKARTCPLLFKFSETYQSNETTFDSPIQSLLNLFSKPYQFLSRVSRIGIMNLTSTETRSSVHSMLWKSWGLQAWH